MLSTLPLNDFDTPGKRIRILELWNQSDGSFLVPLFLDSREIFGSIRKYPIFHRYGVLEFVLMGKDFDYPNGSKVALWVLQCKESPFSGGSDTARIIEARGSDNVSKREPVGTNATRAPPSL